MPEVDREQRTEQATPRRRQHSREKGEFARSQDLAGAAVLLGSIAALALGGDHIAAALIDFARAAFGELHAAGRAPALPGFLAALGACALPAGAVGATLALGTGLGQSGGAVTFRPILPDLARLDPVKRFREMFASADGLVEIAKSVVKFAIVGAVAVLYLRAELPPLLDDPPADAAAAASSVAGVLLGLGARACAAFLVIAAADWLLARFRFERNLRMSRQELRDEIREEEGDPHLRRRRRQRHRELARRRMLAEVPKADVVLVNPTEYAVALRYDAARMRAPRVVAKGRLHLAERIREIARRAGVPILRQPALARMVYAAAEVGREVPVHLYRAVAEVLAFVYRLRRAGRKVA